MLDLPHSGITSLWGRIAAYINGGWPLAPHRGRLAPHKRPFTAAICSIGQLDDAIVITAGAIYEVSNIMNAIKEKRQLNMADVKIYDYNENAEDAYYEEI